MGDMNAIRIVGVVLIVVGILGLALGSFSFTKETHQAQMGPLTIEVKDKQTVNVPIWAGVASIAVGGALLFFRAKKK